MKPNHQAQKNASGATPRAQDEKIRAPMSAHAGQPGSSPLPSDEEMRERLATLHREDPVFYKAFVCLVNRLAGPTGSRVKLPAQGAKAVRADDLAPAIKEKPEPPPLDEQGGGGAHERESKARLQLPKNVRDIVEVLTKPNSASAVSRHLHRDKDIIQCRLPGAVIDSFERDDVLEYVGRVMNDSDLVFRRLILPGLDDDRSIDVLRIMTPRQERLYWREWGAVRACQARGWPEPDRHELHRKAVGASVSHKLFDNVKLDRVLAAFRSYSRPDDLEAQLRPDSQKRARLVWKIRQELLPGLALYVDHPDAYVERICRDKFGTASWEQLSEVRADPARPSPLEQLVWTLTRCLSGLRARVSATR
jgi:hypothetical protein